MNGELVAHAGFLVQPLHKGLYRVHRLVVLPDYQGIGIGVRFVTECAKIVAGFASEVQLMTTTPALVNALRRSPDWWLKDYGRRAPHLTSKLLDGCKRKMLDGASSRNRITYSFYLHKPK